MVRWLEAFFTGGSRTPSSQVHITGRAPASPKAVQSVDCDYMTFKIWEGAKGDMKINNSVNF